MQMTCTAMPKTRLSNEPDERFSSEASPAPVNDPTVEPRLLIDIKSANRGPSIPGGHNWPDKMRNGMNLDGQDQKSNSMMKISNMVQNT